MKEVIISAEDSGRRLDKFLMSYFPAVGFGFIQKMIRKKNITVNGKKTHGASILKEGDTIEVFFSDETFNNFKNPAGYKEDYSLVSSISFDELNIVYEDEEKLVINKSFDRLSQKAKSEDISVNELVQSYLINTKGYSLEEFSAFRPSVVNRLDRNTGGLIIAAKTRAGAVKLTELIAKKHIKRYYVFLCKGHFDKEGIYSACYRKNEAKNTAEISSDEELLKYKDWSKITTGFKLLKYENNISMVEAQLLTGKSHQIRAHSAFLGFPLIGDLKYGYKENDKMSLSLPAQYLFAYKLVLQDGQTIEIDIPKEYLFLLRG